MGHSPASFHRRPHAFRQRPAQRDCEALKVICAPRTSPSSPLPCSPLLLLQAQRPPGAPSQGNGHLIYSET